MRLKRYVVCITSFDSSQGVAKSSCQSGFPPAATKLEDGTECRL